MARQKELAGMERKSEKEIDAAAELYVVERNKRMRQSKKEKASKDALIAVMKKHKQDVYRDDTHNPPLVVMLSTMDGVKVTEAEPDDDGGDDSAGEFPEDE